MGRLLVFFFQAEDGIRDLTVTGVQTCALPIFLQGRGLAVGVVALAAALEDVDVIGSAGHGCLLTCTRGHAQGSITAESAMKFGIHIGHMGGPLGEMRKLWKFADARGFDWFSVSDHFQESPPRGGGRGCYEAAS